MKQGKIINAYAGLEELAKNNNLNEQEQWKLYNLRKQLRQYAEFQIERENAIRDKYKEYAEGDGELVGDKADEYINDMNELLNMDVDIDINEKPQIRFVKGVTLINAEPLEDFIDFIPV